MLGERGSMPACSSHAWLEAEGGVIDITADQFSEMPQRVIVVPHSEWHAAWQGKVQHKADFRIFDPDTVARLDRAYQTILARMAVSI